MVLEDNGFCLMTLPFGDGQQDNVEMHVHPLEEQVGMEEAKKEVGENLDIKMELFKNFDKVKGCMHSPPKKSGYLNFEMILYTQNL
jgi:hypothetical protein